MEIFSLITIIIMGINSAAYLFNKYIRRRHYDALYCGLFGFCGSRPPDMNKIKILGIFNQSRGTHSCGYWYDGQLVKGVNKTSEWKDFIIQNVIVPTPNAKVFIGHTRQATMGAHSEENAHPFEFDNLIGAHNGKIENYAELCARYGVDIKGLNVDSKAFLKLIDEVGFGVLNEYRGFAALLMTKKDDPNALYIYRGASKRYATAQEEQEERPLYYLKSEEGIYVSSMCESLQSIRLASDEDVFFVPENEVIRIKAGKFSRERFLVDRSSVNYGMYGTVTSRNQYYEGWDGETVIARSHSTNRLPPSNNVFNNPNNSGVGGTTGTTAGTFTNSGPAIIVPPKANDKIEPIIFQEAVPLKNFKVGYAYFHKGRYWLIDSEQSAVPKLIEGQMVIDKSGKVLSQNDMRGTEYYFHKGVMLRDKAAWKSFTELRLRPRTEEHDMMWYPSKNAAKIMSKYSKYPVTNLASDAVQLAETERFRWYHNGEAANTPFSPKFSIRHYKIKDGILTMVSSAKTEDKIFILKGTKDSEGNEQAPLIEIVHPSELEEKLNQIAQFPVVGGTKNIIEESAKEYTQTEIKNRIEELKEMLGDLNGKEVEKITEDEIPIMIKVMVEKFCDRTFDRISEVIEDCPSTILNGIWFFLEDKINAKGEELTDLKRSQFLEEFINDIVDNKRTIREMMDPSYPSIDQYVYFAYLEETQEEEDPDSLDVTMVEDAEVATGTETEADACCITGQLNAGKVIHINPASIAHEIDQEQEDMIAQERLEHVLGTVKELREYADQLQALPNSDLAQDSANSIYQLIDMVTSKLGDTFVREGKTDLLKINNAITTDN